MRWIYALRLRLRSLFRRAQVEKELRAEFQYHLDRQMERNEAGGMSPFCIVGYSSRAAAQTTRERQWSDA